MSIIPADVLGSNKHGYYSLQHDSDGPWIIYELEKDPGSRFQNMADIHFRSRISLKLFVFWL